MPCPFDAQRPYSRRCRRLPSGAARASRPSGLRLLRTSEYSASNGSNSSALRRGGTALRSPAVSALSGQCLDRSGRRPTTTMASADFCHDIAAPFDAASPKAPRQISQGKTRDFPPTHPPHLRRLDPDDLRLRVDWPSRLSSRRLVCGSCTSGREFAFRFLRIPPRGGHPCGSARSSRHQSLRRDFHPASHFLARFRSPVASVRS